MLAPPSPPVIRADPAPSGTPTRAPDTPRRAAAEALEASFLAEMLKATGLGEQENGFSGSAGESQFASFQRDAIARAIVERGGIVLADIIEVPMKEKTRDSDIA